MERPVPNPRRTVAPTGRDPRAHPVDPADSVDPEASNCGVNGSSIFFFFVETKIEHISRVLNDTQAP